MNSVHLVTREKNRVESGQKQAECIECTAQSQPARLGSTRPAPACRAPRARPARLPLLAPSACPRACLPHSLRTRQRFARPCRAAPRARPSLLPARLPPARPAPCLPARQRTPACPPRAPCYLPCLPTHPTRAQPPLRAPAAPNVKYRGPAA